MNPESKGKFGRRSAAETDKDPEYKFVASIDGDRFSFRQPHVVEHLATGTLWATVFAVRDDDSDYELPTHWFQVEKKVEVVEKVTYVRVGS